ncbi:MAG: hypothetical protein JXA18_01200 [Chitinispirillaceae bacterium]|nr:hypothetical protein [Chitinispirillaceae bacterium]
MRRFRPARVAVIALCILLYGLIFIHFTAPLTTRFDNAVVSGYLDAHVFVWNIHTFTELVHSNRNPFYTDDVCHPRGVWLIMHTYAPLTGIINLFVGNPALTLNLFVFLNFMLSATGAMLLCYSFIPNWCLAFLSGFVFAFCPFKMTHLFAGQYNLIMTAPIPFYVYFLRRCLPPSENLHKATAFNRRFLPHCITLLLFEFACDYYLTYYLLLFTAGYIAYHRFTVQAWSGKRFVTVSIIAITASMIGVGILELIGVNRNGLYTSADLISYFVPSAYSRLFGGSCVNSLRSEVIKGSPFENIAEAGLALIILFALFMVFDFRRTCSGAGKEAAYMTLFFFVMATPVVNVAGRPLVVLPSVFLHYTPFVNNFRVASRMTIMIMLFLPITGLSFLHRHCFAPGRRITAYVVAGLVFVSLYLQYLPAPFPLLSINDVPAVYRMPALRGEGTLLELPFGIQSGNGLQLGTLNTLQMVYQAIHRKKVLGGYISRLPASLADFYAQYPFLSTVFDLMRTGRRDAPPPLPADVETFLHDFHVRHVIVYPGYGKSAAGEYALKAIDPFITGRTLIDGYAYLALRPLPADRRQSSFTPHRGGITSAPARHRRISLKHLLNGMRPRLRKGPMRELEAVRNALETAQSAGSDTAAPALYSRAQRLSDKAQEEIRVQHETLPFLRDFSTAKLLLDSALSCAERSIDRRHNKAAVRQRRRVDDNPLDFQSKTSEKSAKR